MTKIQLMSLFEETLKRQGVPGSSHLAAVLTATLIAAQRDRNGVDLGVHVAETISRAIRGAR